MNLLPVNTSLIRKEEEIIMGRCNKQEFYEIFRLRFYTGHSLATPALGPVKTNWISLNIAIMTDGHHHVFFRYKILHINVSDILKDLCPALIPIFFLDILYFILNNLEYHSFAFQNCLKPRYILD